MQYIIRQAKKEECYELAQMINLAGQGPGTCGLDFSGWSSEAKMGQDPFEVGKCELEKDKEVYSYTNIRVLELDGEKAALAMCFEAWKRTPQELEEIPELFRIFKHLTDTIPGKFYLDSLAAKPEYRGQGLGQIMLDDCIDLAKAREYDAVYLIAFEKNIAGIGLYQKNGFKEVRSLPNTDHSDMPYQGGKVILYKKDI
jgi:ribosomal protein S18 acetylase RimI-like enzyme